jgi:hypothetical protein
MRIREPKNGTDPMGPDPGSGPDADSEHWEHLHFSSKKKSQRSYTTVEIKVFLTIFV